MGISLVTGGSGFIGQHLVDTLLAGGETVRILDLEAPTRRLGDVEFIQGSVTNARLVREAMDGVRHVYHAAALSDLWLADPSLFEQTNVVGTRVVCEAARDERVERLVYTSSATVLIDDAVGRRTVTLDERHETDMRRLTGAYARSKWRAERLAFSYGDRLPVIAVLPTLPLGPGDRHLTPPGRMLLDFINGSIPAYTDCLLNVIDVRDVAAGHRLACAWGRPGRRYILNRHSLPMAVFLRTLEALTGRRMPRWRIPGLLAVTVSAALESWSNLISGRAPMAPLAGTRASLRPIIFDSSLADAELNLPITPLVETLTDAVTWLANEGHITDSREGAALVFGD